MFHVASLFLFLFLTADPAPLPDLNKLRSEYKAAQVALVAAQEKADKAKADYLAGLKAINDAATEDGIDDGTDRRKPKPSPIVKAQRLAVMIIEETGEAVGTRGAMFASRKLSDWITAKQTVWRVADKDAKNAAGQTPADLVPYINLAAGKKLPQIFILDMATNKLLLQGDCPTTADALLALMEKYQQ